MSARGEEMKGLDVGMGGGGWVETFQLGEFKIMSSVDMTSDTMMLNLCSPWMACHEILTISFDPTGTRMTHVLLFAAVV